jgi:ribosomal protein S18 acetylase RimI-like enzyme
MGEIEIRPLTEADVPAFVALRRQGLAAEPMAFGASLEDDVTNRPDDIVRGLARAPEMVTWVAVDDGVLVGCIGVARESKTKMRHKAGVFGTYVDPRARRRGVAQRLVETAIAHARSIGVTHLHLVVSAGTPEPERLYRRMGFVRWGTEPEALLIDGRALDDHHMVLRLG